MKKILIFSLLASFLVSCNGNAQKNSEDNSPEKFEVSKTDAEWKEELSSEEFAVLRNAATETPFSRTRYWISKNLELSFVLPVEMSYMKPNINSKAVPDGQVSTAQLRMG